MLFALGQRFSLKKLVLFKVTFLICFNSLNLLGEDLTFHSTEQLQNIHKKVDLAEM